MLTSMFLVGTVFCLIGSSADAVALQISEHFFNEGDVSYGNDNGILLEVNTSRKITNAQCAAKCLDDLSCNAIELCSTPTGQTCRLSRGWKNTGNTLSHSTCRRLQMVDECEGEGYVDRRNRICTYDECQTCDCVSQFMGETGVYGIVIGGDLKKMYCSFEESYTWTVIQRRHDGSENFYRNWTDYEFGFGSPASEVWLGKLSFQGNKYIHRLTANGHNVLRIELEDHDGNKRYAEYSSFTVADVTDNYRIQVSGYTGDAGNTLERNCYYCNNGQPFTTYDRDNDNYKGNCAVWAKGGWWHNGCQNSCLNGQYGDSRYGQGVNWEDWKNLKYSFKSSLMKVRRSL
uniref:Angiopoietin-related protein 6 n=1 Tax=Magallana gigas TaxID=29159 RepID=K1Q0Y6_MAGGI